MYTCCGGSSALRPTDDAIGGTVSSVFCMFYPVCSPCRAAYPGDMHVDRLSLSLFQLRVALLAGWLNTLPSPLLSCAMVRLIHSHALTPFTSWLELASMGFNPLFLAWRWSIFSRGNFPPCEPQRRSCFSRGWLTESRSLTPFESLLLAFRIKHKPVPYPTPFFPSRSLS
jgi:hypothetical protein